LNPGYAVLVEKAGHFLEKAGVLEELSWNFKKSMGLWGLGTGEE
jgi:hypothetical protein